MVLMATIKSASAFAVAQIVGHGTERLPTALEEARRRHE
jgi:hypothetical protein